MDTRRIPGTQRSLQPAGELGTDTMPVNLVELAQVRYVLSCRGEQSLGAAVSTFLVIVMLSAIVFLAIASSAGWSVLDPWSG